MILSHLALFVFIFSIVFLLRYVIVFFGKLFSNNPTSIILTKLEKILLTIFFSYIITYIIITF